MRTRCLASAVRVAPRRKRLARVIATAWLVVLAVLAACQVAPVARRGAPAERGYFSTFHDLWLQDELAACPELALAPRYDLGLELADDLRRVDGTLALRYANRLQRPLEQLPFFCYPNAAGGALEVNAIQVDGVPVRPAGGAGGSMLAVPLPVPLPPGAWVRVDMRFTLRVPEGRPEEPRLFALSDGLLSLGHAYPMVPAPAAWSDRRPTGYGDFVTNEVAFFTARIGLPAGVQLVAPGVELSRREQEGRREVLLALGPARELYMAAGRDLVLLEERRGTLTVCSAARRGQEREALEMLEAAHAALEIFGRRLGPYPFRRFVLVAAPLRALGMEFPGVVMLASRLYEALGQRPGDPQPRFELEGTLAHEAAHQWFYAMVGSDQLLQPWIDESLAQYCFWLYYRDRYGEGEAARRELEDTWDRADRAELPIGLPVGAYGREEYGAIIYGRAPLFLARLAEVMGQERFEVLLQELARRHRWGIVNADGLRVLAQEVAARAPGQDAGEAGLGPGGAPDPPAEAIDRLWREWVLPRQAADRGEPSGSTE